MKLIGKRKLTKLAIKNRGNVKLQKAIKVFENEIRESSWVKQTDLEKSKIEFDLVHSDGFYIADLSIHRAMIAITFVEQINYEKLKEDYQQKDIKKSGEVEILWLGTHDEYIRTFGNNKNQIEKWLRNRGYIS